MTNTYSRFRKKKISLIEHESISLYLLSNWNNCKYHYIIAIFSRWMAECCSCISLIFSRNSFCVSASVLSAFKINASRFRMEMKLKICECSPATITVCVYLCMRSLLADSERHYENCAHPLTLIFNRIPHSCDRDLLSSKM